MQLTWEADLEKAFGGQGEHGEKILKADIAKDLYRSEEANPEKGIPGGMVQRW